jgi:hypothetical protein
MGMYSSCTVIELRYRYVQYSTVWVGMDYVLR